MKRILFIACVLIISAVSYAHDIIVTTNSQKIEAKILEVSKTEIRYKEIDNLEGPTFVLETKEINSIIYANGKVVLYNQPAETNREEEVISHNTPTDEESMAEILLMSGNTITAQITALKSDHVGYLLNGKPHAIQASQVNKVTFLHNGQVKTYNGQGSVIVKEDNSEKKESDISKRIYRDGSHYMYNNTYISSKEVERILQRENAAAYNRWQEASRMHIGAGVCTGIGCGMAIGGLVSLVTDNYIYCIAVDCAALVPLGVGLGLALGASSRYNQAINIYNSKYDHAAIQFKWSVAPNGIGIAFAF